jgi:hypothetical protein
MGGIYWAGSKGEVVQDTRELAARGMKVKAYKKEAERLESKWRA